MKILAIDTTAKTAAAAITDGERLLASATLNTPSTHSVTMLPTVEMLLKGAALSVSDIDMLAVSAGPGSFTGVRIGVSLIKGLAFGTDKLCVGVSSLEALARNLSVVNGLICPVMDARRNQLYNALFISRGGKLTRLTEDRLITTVELGLELEKKREGMPVYFVGDGYGIAASRIEGVGAVEVPENLRWQSGYSVAMTALAKYSECGGDEDKLSAFTAAKLSPVYLRASQAERERNERLKGENAR